MSDETSPNIPSPAPAAPSGETLNQQIDSLNQGVLNMQALADHARAKGDFIRAQTLNAEAVAMSGDLNKLRKARRDQAFSSEAWSQLAAHLDALNAEALKTEGKMQSAEDSVETAKTVVGLVSKLVTAL